MKNAILVVFILSCAGCAGTAVEQGAGGDAQAAAPPACLGNNELPPVLQGRLVPVDDPVLLAKSIGGPGKGKLCQGRVYQVTEGARVRVWRAWNSTNPRSELGQWWAAQQPGGKVAQYRRDYEICFQWSPLDKLTHCVLGAGARVVVGTGQSATCSEYLSYSVSAAQQVFIDDAASVVSECSSYDGEFSWRAVAR